MQIRFKSFFQIFFAEGAGEELVMEDKVLLQLYLDVVHYGTTLLAFNIPDPQSSFAPYQNLYLVVKEGERLVKS